MAEKTSNKIIIELDYEPGSQLPSGVRLNLSKVSIVDIILAWTSLTEKVIEVTKKPEEEKCLTQFIGNTIASYFKEYMEPQEDDGAAEEEVATME